MKSDPTFWILSRATGFTAYALLTTSVVAGLVLKGRVLGRAVKPATITDLHRFLALLGLMAIGLHGLALVGDSYVDISFKALVVPGIIPYRPLWTGTGVVAAELMVLIYVSFSVRRWLGTKNWRRLHWLTYGVFAAATVHGLMSGSDTGRPWVVYGYLSAIGVVAAATGFRAVAPPLAARRPPVIQPTEERRLAA